MKSLLTQFFSSLYKRVKTLKNSTTVHDFEKVNRIASLSLGPLNCDNTCLTKEENSRISSIHEQTKESFQLSEDWQSSCQNNIENSQLICNRDFYKLNYSAMSSHAIQEDELKSNVTNDRQSQPSSTINSSEMYDESNLIEQEKVME